jgi:hypothetical protein
LVVGRKGNEIIGESYKVSSGIKNFGVITLFGDDVAVETIKKWVDCTPG